MNDLVKLAPAILGFLGGPAGGLAGAGLEWLAGKLGAKEATADAIKQTLQGFTAADTVRLRELDVEFQKFCIESDIKLELAQIEINLQDAKSEHWWQFGWRPAIGWVCVAVLALSYIPKALALTAFWSYQSYLLFTHPEVRLPALPPFPDLGMTDVLGILGTLLGAGWMAKLRTDEKVTKGTR